MKICKKCNRKLNLNNFSKRSNTSDGLYIYCKECVSIRYAQYNNEHKKERKMAKKIYYKKNKEAILNHIKETRPRGSRNAYLKQYYIKNKKKAIQKAHDYRIKNRDKINKWYNKYYKNPAKRIARNMYNRVRIAIFTQLAMKSQKTSLLCGCSWEELVQHLEKQFKQGMSWDTYGRGEGKWSIDHILSCDKFDLTNPKEQQKCFHYTNLQPLWSNENSSKRNK